MKVVEITWEDAWSSDDIWTVGELKKHGPYLVLTLGYLLYEDKKVVTLAAEHRKGSERHRHVIVIPKSLIRSRRVFK